MFLRSHNVNYVPTAVSFYGPNYTINQCRIIMSNFFQWDNLNRNRDCNFTPTRLWHLFVQHVPKCFLCEIAKNQDSLTFNRQRATWLFELPLADDWIIFIRQTPESTACKRKWFSRVQARVLLDNVSTLTLLANAFGNFLSLRRMFFESRSRKLHST